MTFAAWLAEQITRRRLLKKDVADGLNIRPATVSGWLNSIIPSGGDLARIRRMFDLSNEETAAMMDAVSASEKN